MRKRISIYDTLASGQTINAAQIVELAGFVAKNRELKLQVQEARPILNTKTFSVTPVSTIFERMLELNKDRLFSYIRIPQGTVAVPEVITYTHITFDSKQFGAVSGVGYRLIASMPELADTIITNVTPMLRRTGELVDAPRLQGMCIRDLLSRSYYDNPTSLWLTASLIQYLCRCYSMSISVAISGVYNLSFFESRMVMTVFAYYFLRMVTTDEMARAMLKNTSKFGLGTSVEIGDVLSMVDAVVPPDTDMTLDHACQAVGGLGIDRLKAVNRKLLYTVLRSIGPDLQTSMIALEYPPYFTYLVLLALSGQKIGLLYRLKQGGLEKDGAQFATDLALSQSFLHSI